MPPSDQQLRDKARDTHLSFLIVQGFGGSDVERGYFYRRDVLTVEAMLAFAKWYHREMLKESFNDRRDDRHEKGDEALTEGQV